MKRLLVPTQDGLWLAGHDLFSDTPRGIGFERLIDDPWLVQEGVPSRPYAVSSAVHRATSQILYRFVLGGEILEVALTIDRPVWRHGRSAAFVANQANSSHISVNRHAVRLGQADISIPHSPDAARLMRLEQLRQEALDLIAQARASARR